MGFKNVAEKDDDKGWWRAGNANRVGEGLVSSPTTARKPARLSSSSSIGFSLERMPTSSRSFEPSFEMEKSHAWSLQKELIVSVCDMVSKSKSI